MNILKLYPRFIFLGFLTCFLSGFGQSFFLSLFTPYFLDLLSLSNSSFGFIYASATMASGLVMPKIGKRLNFENPRLFVTLCLIGLAGFAFSFAWISHPGHLWMTVAGLRFFGQGMLTHISATLMAASFMENRGKALSIANLGFPANEAILPLLVLVGSKYLSTPSLWMIFAFAILLSAGFVPYLLKGKNGEITSKAASSTGKTYKDFRGLKSLTFWYYATPAVLPAFIFTALFLYHAILLEGRNLPFELVAKSLILFAFARLLASLSAGVLVDKFGSKVLFPGYLVPMVLGLLLLSYIHTPWAFTLYLVLGGLTLGAAGTVVNSVWSEVYGPKLLASVRSYMASIAILSTAAGPFLFGFAIDYLWNIEFTLKILTFTQLTILLVSWIFRGRFQ